MIAIPRFSTRNADFETRLARLIDTGKTIDDSIDRAVDAILADVMNRGDDALLEYTRRFDRVRAESIRALDIPQEALRQALGDLPTRQRDALETAARRIRDFHERQLSSGWTFEDGTGVTLGQKITPLGRVGLYVPGGKAAYPSSVLMNAIPARVAGVAELIMVVPTPDGERNPLVLAAAALAGIDRVLALGGAQAIGALAYGTKSIPKVDKIVGPGNAYVAAAKRRVFGKVGIDMVAGPSEILILCDGKTPPDWIALDLFSQAEHDELAQSILLCPDSAYIDAVIASIEKLLPEMPREAIIRAALENRGALIEVNDLDEACALANRLAPEHLELSIEDADRWVDKIQNAGAIFIGAYASESLGDYCAGPNHVLPTSGSARFSSPLGVYDFQKRTSLIRVTESASQTLGEIASTLARGEGLFAHARSAESRLRRR